MIVFAGDAAEPQERTCDRTQRRQRASGRQIGVRDIAENVPVRHGPQTPRATGKPTRSRARHAQ